MKLNQYIVGDCLEIMKEMEDNSVDLIVTDPPYGIDYKTNHRKNKSHEFCSPISNDQNLLKMEFWLSMMARVLKDNSAIYLFTNHDKIDEVKPLFSRWFTYKNTITWVKNNWTAGDLECQFGKQTELILYGNKGRAPIIGLRCSDVWHASRVVGDDQYHQNQKPVDLIGQCIRKHAGHDALVLDPFAGSGTTAVACTELNRNWICIDIEPKYKEIAMKRLQGTTIGLNL